MLFSNLVVPNQVHFHLQYKMRQVMDDMFKLNLDFQKQFILAIVSLQKWFHKFNRGTELENLHLFGSDKSFVCLAALTYCFNCFVNIYIIRANF